MSYRTEVIADNSGQWVGNGLRFATKEEAEAYVFDLMMRWTLVRDTRVVWDDETANYYWDIAKSHAEPLKPEPEVVTIERPTQEKLDL